MDKRLACWSCEPHLEFRWISNFPCKIPAVSCVKDSEGASSAMRPGRRRWERNGGQGYGQAGRAFRCSPEGTPTRDKGRVGGKGTSGDRGE